MTSGRLSPRASQGSQLYAHSLSRSRRVLFPIKAGVDYLDSNTGARGLSSKVSHRVMITNTITQVTITNALTSVVVQLNLCFAVPAAGISRSLARRSVCTTGL